MHLSPEQLAVILGESGTEPLPDGVPVERRRAPRVRVQVHCQVQVVLEGRGRGMPIAVEVRDVSARGLCCLISPAMVPGTQVVISFSGEGPERAGLLCGVINC